MKLELEVKYSLTSGQLPVLIEVEIETNSIEEKLPKIKWGIYKEEIALKSSKLKTTLEMEEAIEDRQTKMQGVMEKVITYKKRKNVEVFLPQQ